MNREAHQWSLAACGRHGDISADLDRPSDDRGSWFLEISGTRWSVRFSISGPGVVRELLDFVRVQSVAPGFARHEIAKSVREEVLLVKNSDLGVRFALVIRSKDSVSEATIQDREVESFRRVLEEIVADVADEPKG